LIEAEDRVRFLGHRADAEQLLGLLDVFWSSSDCDPLPTATLQAMAAGVPVVASDIPGRETLISAGETGFLARVGSRTEFARPTDRLYQEAELAQRIGQAGRQHVSKCFSLDQMVDHYGDLYREL
jgi:glycosyltransferase involved in cell wall biosynthesis